MLSCLNSIITQKFPSSCRTMSTVSAINTSEKCITRYWFRKKDNEKYVLLCFIARAPVELTVIYIVDVIWVHHQRWKIYTRSLSDGARIQDLLYRVRHFRYHRHTNVCSLLSSPPDRQQNISLCQSRHISIKIEIKFQHSLLSAYIPPQI